jgi:hypothetical protein
VTGVEVKGAVSVMGSSEGRCFSDEQQWKVPF